MDELRRFARRATVVFDLLGDIYQMPISGGPAQLLAGGRAWEVQPRYSPDGKWIAFTSDRDGGDNIWLMDTAGKNRRQITKETQRLTNTPAGRPTVSMYVVRKHFVDQRSLGAGEIWMYSINGGARLTTDREVELDGERRRAGV